MQAIIQIPQVQLLPEAKTMAERQLWQRTTLGLTQKQAAAEIGVDHGTLARWERGEREPVGEMLVRVNQFLVAANESETAA